MNDDFNKACEMYDEIPEEKPVNMADLAKQYGAEKASIKAAELAIKKRKTGLLQMEASLYEQMELAGMQSFKSGGQSFNQRVDTYCSIDRSQQDAAFEWVRENGYSDLIIETVNARSLTSAVKEYMETTGEAPAADDGIKINEVRRVGVRL